MKSYNKATYIGPKRIESMKIRWESRLIFKDYGVEILKIESRYITEILFKSGNFLQQFYKATLNVGFSE